MASHVMRTVSYKILQFNIPERSQFDDPLVSSLVQEGLQTIRLGFSLNNPVTIAMCLHTYIHTYILYLFRQVSSGNFKS